MCRLTAVALTTNLLMQLTTPRPDDVLLSVPQRDSLRSRTGRSSLSVSADGRHVAFVSYARLVAADTDERASIYVLDRLSGVVTLESVAVDGAPVPGDSGHPRISGDGQRVVFDTAVAEGSEEAPTVQVFIRDRVARSTALVSRTTDGKVPNAWSREPAISTDGSVVVFTSAATDLVPGRDENGIRLDVYRYDVATRHIDRVSLDITGAQRPEGSSYDAGVSATGRFVAFVSTANLVTGSAGGRLLPSAAPPQLAHVYLRDLRFGVTTRLTHRSGSEPANGGSWAPGISDDGRHVVFVSAADNLVRDDGNRAPDAFLHDTSSGLTTLISRSAHRGAANGTSINPAISADGGFVAFQSDASDLVCASRCTAAQEDINLVFDVFLFDRRTRMMTRVSAGPNGGWEEESGGPAISADGHVIGFTSRRPIDADDTANDFDLFVSVNQNRRTGNQEE